MSDPMTPAPHPKPLPCPGCKQECRSVTDRHETVEWVECRYCGYHGPFATSAHTAIEKHNALCAASGIPTWQPIETAPKTGEHILVAEFNPERIGFGFCGGKKQSMMTVAHWWDNPSEEGWYASVDSQGEYPFPATHWKPLEEVK